MIQPMQGYSGTMPPQVVNIPSYVPPPPRIQTPPVHTPPVQPPHYPPGNYPPNAPPGQGPVPKKSGGSGCGCLLAFLIVVGIVAAIGRFGTTSKPGRPSDYIHSDSMHSAQVPMRPVAPFLPPPLPVGDFTFPVLRDCSIEKTGSGYDEKFSMRATVGPGSYRRVQLAVYLLDSFSYSVVSRDFDHKNSAGTLCAGKWVTWAGGDEHDDLMTAVTTEVQMTLPTSSARSPVAAAQFSMFTESGVELARITVPLQGVSPRYPGPSR